MKYKNGVTSRMFSEQIPQKSEGASIFLLNCIKFNIEIEVKTSFFNATQSCSQF